MNDTQNFFQQNTSTAAENLPLNEEAKIQEILAEQEKLQKLYNEVVLYIQQHPQMSTDEMIKYQTQLKQLSEYYQLNQQKLKTLGYSRVQVNKNVVIKSGAKRNLSLKTIFLGCAMIIGLFVLGLSILSFYLANNPEKLGGFGSLGIQPAVAKSILLGLSLTIMLVILGLGVVILILNVYKAFTIKNKPKAWYYAGMTLGIVILGIGLGAGTSLLDKVGRIDVISIANPNDVVAMYMHTLDEDRKPTNLFIDGSFPLIAPVNVLATPASENFNKFIQDKFQGQVGEIEKYELNCGNGQILDYSEKLGTFEDACFYTKKGSYPIRLIAYFKGRTTARTPHTFDLKVLEIGSELTVQGVDKPLSGGKNELVIGPLPALLELRADQVFKDFGMREYVMEWDGDSDGIIDRQNDMTFRFNYDEAKVYTPRVKFPRLSEVWYSFPLRVEQSGIPVCKIELQQQKVNDYQILASFFDGTERFVSDHSFVVYDKATGKLIDEIHDPELGFQLDYRFPGKGNYIVKMNFITSDDKKGACEVEAKLVEKSTFNVLYEVHASSPNDMTYKKMAMDPIYEKKIVSLAEIPTKIKLKLLKVEPRTFNTKINVFFDQKPVIFTTEGEYLFDVRDAKEHKILIQIQDKVRGLEYEEQLTTKIGLDDIIGKLSILGESVGFEPFEVTLDASSSRLNDPNDQITYFSWDFGDGQQQQKVSNGVIKHRYRFDYANNQGSFLPKVTVYTQKGRSLLVEAASPIVVKKQLIKVEISSVSHPTQEAKI